ncbi:Zn-ribbon domain-containing OB-fold protein [Streptomyces iranensis]|uniref:Zn-ribbon domain-containing OB-fold protein n=1 Tax=Streptomyces iranensis TaxID=576784 RepID=UPI0039B76B33
MTITVVPNQYIDTSEFWAAAREGRLVVQYDRATGTPQWFPRALSLSSGRRDLEWRPVSGAGALYSWTVTHSPWPGHEDRVPYVCALVDLDEGVRMLCNLLTDDPEGLTIGERVRLVWQDVADGVRYPAFEVAR